MNTKRIKYYFKNHSFMDILVKIIKNIINKLSYTKNKFLIQTLNKINLNKSFHSYNTKMTFFYKYSNKSKVKSFYLSNKNLKLEILNESSMILEHKFNLLGSDIMDLGTKIKWNEDFKTNYIWENKFYKDIIQVDLTNYSDIKVPWELSRFQHFFCLGKAYWITDDDIYYYEFKSQVLDWVQKNPYCMSVNWTCAMDVGIRSINWIFAFFHFEEKIIKDVSLRDLLYNSLYQHGKFIYRNLENKHNLNNNHYLSNLIALVYLGLFFEGLSNGLLEHKNWLKFGMKELEKEMFIQNNTDGTNYESSTSYHRLVSEIYLYALLIVEKNGLEFSSDFKSRLNKMHDFILNLSKPNGLSPLIGDADSGRLVIVSPYNDKRDLNNTLGIAGLYFDRKDYLYLGQKFPEENLWIMGKSLSNKYLESRLKSKAFYKGGFYILRNKNVYCLIRCGELSLRGHGGHSHNDQLSIELNIKGYDFFIDPGISSYTGNFNDRNLFRSTRMHNTISIVGYEQNYFDEKELFSMKEQTFSNCLSFNNNSFEGMHLGYKKDLNVVHKRSITINDKYISIKDNLINYDMQKYETVFILHPNVEVLNSGCDTILVHNEVKIILTNNLVDEIEDVWVSFEYGKKIKSKRIILYRKNDILIKVI